MKNIFFFSLSLFWLYGCKDQPCDCPVLSNNSAITIHYMDSVGNNLINSSELYNEQNIKIYYKIGDKYEYQFNPNMDNPNKYAIGYNKDTLLLTVFPSDHYFDNNYSETLIKLNPEVVDTLLCQFKVSGEDRWIERWFINGIEKFDRQLRIEK